MVVINHFYFFVVKRCNSFFLTAMFFLINTVYKVYSRALTDPETWYATIEREMLAIVFALEKWHQFAHGRHVLVNTDHKPLEAIAKKSLNRAPKRLQGMLF